MKAADIMTPNPVTVQPDTSITEAIRLMLQRKFSGLPVTNDKGVLVGILTEGDFLRRAETGTQRKRPRWIEFFIGPGRLASEYAHSAGRTVHEVMTASVHTISDDAPLDQIVKIMERHQVKRLPVMRDGKLVGIVSRANLLHALASVAKETKPATVDDLSIRERLIAELNRQPWAPVNMVDVVVRNGVVHLWGTILDERQRQGIRVAAENTLGVKSVEDHLVWVEPTTGMVIPPLEEDKPASAR